MKKLLTIATAVILLNCAHEVQAKKMTYEQKQQLKNQVNQTAVLDMTTGMAMNQMTNSLNPNHTTAYNPYQAHSNVVISGQPIKILGGDESSRTPKVLQTIQELRTKITTLESRIEALEQFITDLQNKNTTSADDVEIQAIMPGTGMKAIGVKSDQQNIQYAKSTAQSKK